MAAAGPGHEAIVRLLLDRGANTEAKNIVSLTSRQWGYRTMIRRIRHG